jgi:CheY-like chemotaxis protein
MHINLSKANVLIVDESPHGFEILAQILRGFGVGAVTHAANLADAEREAQRAEYPLILVDAALDGGKIMKGIGFVRQLRRLGGDKTGGDKTGGDKNRQSPVIVLSGHALNSTVLDARDAGANFYVAKPITPTVLLDRIQWLVRDRRQWVDAGDAYFGPDRRFKFIGPPAGTVGRRAEDKGGALGEAWSENLSEAELSGLIKPQRVSL